MTILEYHKQFKLFLDKVSSEQLPEFTSKQIDVFLHEAEVRIVKQAYGQNNIYKKGYQEIQKRTDDLNTLVKTAYLKPVPYIASEDDGALGTDGGSIGSGDQAAEETPLVVDGVYSFSLASLYKSEAFVNSLNDYMFFVKAMVKVKSESIEPTYTGISLVSQDKYTEVIKDPFNKSRISSPVAFFEDNCIKIDTNSLSFQPTAIKLTYIKYPVKVNLAESVSSELPEQKQREALALAVRIAAGSVEAANTQDLANQLGSLE